MLDPFVSVMKKDFVPKTIQSRQKYFIKSEFKDPIKESFKMYLTAIPDSSDTEKDFVDDYIQDFSKERKEISEIYFKEGHLDNDVVIDDLLDDNRTVYDISYCDKELIKKYLAMEEEKKRFRLSENWNVPETTYRVSYRSPSMLAPKAYEKGKIERDPGTLGSDKYLRKILKVSTGFSEYQDVIGRTGDVIIKEKLHGSYTSKCEKSNEN